MSKYYYAPKVSQVNLSPPELTTGNWEIEGTALTVLQDVESTPYVHFSWDGSGSADAVANGFVRVVQDSSGATIPQVADFEAYFEVQWNDLSTTRMGDFRFCGRADLATTGYVTGPRAERQAHETMFVNAGARTTLLDQTLSPTAVIDTRYGVLVRFSGSTIESKFWDLAGTEPTSFTHTVTDSSKLTAGYVGIYSIFPNLYDTRLYKFSIGTGGDPAPRTGADYTIRKGSTATITHTLTAAGITSATLNGEAVTLGTQSGQTASISFTDTITTSGVYDLVLGDGVGTQTLTVQYNVYGLLSSTLKKDGVALGGREGIEMVVLSQGQLPKTILEQSAAVSTDASGNTGSIVLENQLAVPGNTVVVTLRISSENIGIIYGTPLETL